MQTLEKKIKINPSKWSSRHSLMSMHGVCLGSAALVSLQMFRAQFRSNSSSLYHTAPFFSSLLQQILKKGIVAY